MQIPVSSTQCLVGATVGAGIASGGFKQVQWFFLFRVATGWVGTFFITAVVTAGLFSFATYPQSREQFVPPCYGTRIYALK
jgi:sodium-dependent phosphate transporter